MIVAGIDPSLTSTGVCIGKAGGVPYVFRIQSTPIGSSTWARIERCRRIAEQIREAVASGGVERIFIENYSFGSDFNREVMAELGGIVRLAMIEIDARLREVPPRSLKMFVTGKGNARKPVVMQSVRDQWGYETANSDEADAYGLWRLGLCCVGSVAPFGQHQIAAVQTVNDGPKTKASKQRKPKSKPKAKRLF